VRRLPRLDWLHATRILLSSADNKTPTHAASHSCACVFARVSCPCAGLLVSPAMQQVYDEEKGALQHVTFNREDNRGWPSAYWSLDKSMCSITPDHVSDVVGVCSVLMLLLDMYFARARACARTHTRTHVNAHTHAAALTRTHMHTHTHTNTHTHTHI
jgi:hypothetical protein